MSVDSWDTRKNVRYCLRKRDRQLVKEPIGSDLSARHSVIGYFRKPWQAWLVAYLMDFFAPKK